MNENNNFVKEKQTDLFTKGFILLALIVVSLICCFAPVLFNGLNSGKVAFYLIGGLLFVFFSALFVRLLYKEFHPDNVIIISSRGFVDKKNVGPDIEVEWTNVASVKLLGNKDMPFLGITLENCDIVMAKMKEREASEMRENIDENLPHILIAQNEVYTPVNELKDTFVRLIREARILNNEPTQKTKNNPFTTEDVLRAFGKLPPNQDSANEPKDDYSDNESYSVLDNTKDVDNSEEEINESVNSAEENTAEEEPASPTSSSDSFYEVLQDSYFLKSENKSNVAESKTEIIPDQSDNKNDIASDAKYSSEIDEFLSRAKSSKITELNKLLNDKEVSFSVLRDESNDNKTTTEDLTEKPNRDNISSSNDSDVDVQPAVKTDTEPHESVKNEEKSAINYNKDFYIEFPSELYDDSNDKEVEFTFENLIQQTKEFDAFEVPENKEDSDSE